MSDLIERLRGVWPADIPSHEAMGRLAVIEQQELKKEAAEIERLRAEVASLRTGDTCARQCEGQA